jgi:DNA-binding response OmpR family regulator
VKGRVLVIEDDQDISLSIRTVLSRNGFEVTSEADGKDGLRAFHAARPDLVILDIGLPTLDGWSVLERIRDLSDAPVLILTAHGRESDKVRGLHGGADDYLTKPFGNSELAARVEALLRRPRSAAPPAEVFDDGSLQVQFESREVSVNGQEVSLTPTEYRLLGALIKHPGQTLTPEQLLKLAWNDPFGVGPDRVKFGVMRLRRKLSQNASPGRDPGSSIEAVRGFGYRYVAPKSLAVRAAWCAGQSPNREGRTAPREERARRRRR